MKQQMDFFLSANTAEGFYSLHNQLYDVMKMKRVYILKGGPGTGKSTLMKRIADEVCKSGAACERIWSASDPDSLEAVYFPGLHAAIIDGTAPHVMEPELPGAVEEYVNLGQFWDSAKIAAHKEELSALSKIKSEAYGEAYKSLAVARAADNGIFDSIIPGVDFCALRRRAKNLIRSEIPGKGAGFSGKERFISALTCRGFEALDSTIESYPRIIEIRDSFGLSSLFLSYILEYAYSHNFSLYICKDPLRPDNLQTLLFNEIGLAFTNIRMNNSDNCRRVYLDSIAQKGITSKNRAKINLYSIIQNQLLQEATGFLKTAQTAHHQIKARYTPHMDFAAIDKLAIDITGEILA